MPLLIVGIGLIFLLDTLTHYEVAVAVFYAVLILAVGSRLSRASLLRLAIVCVFLTVFSFLLTPTGNLGTGLINTGISIAAIALIVHVHAKIQAAQQQAQAAQQQLARLTQVQSLAGLSSSIAHEINQPLGAMLTSAQACQRWLAQEPPNVLKASQSANRIVQDADRVSAIIARVRSLTQGEQIQREAFDMNVALGETLLLCQPELQAQKISVKTNLMAQLPMALGDQVSFQQTLGNLLLNAIEAMASVPPQFRVLHLATSIEDDSILLTVADTGPGLLAEQEQQMFEAFWTTKRKGMGIGLSISRSMIEAAGGQLWGNNRRDGGAEFYLRLPSVKKEE